MSLNTVAFKVACITTDYNARFNIKKTLIMPQIHSSIYLCFFLYQWKHWNNLPQQLKSPSSKYCLKNLRQHLSDMLYIH